MIEVAELTKRYGSTVALGGVGFSVPPGSVTGLLGPNGAGKTTIVKILLGLVRQDTGRALIHGERYRDLTAPLRTVGALLEAGCAHRGRTARRHLRWLARSNRIPLSRIDAVLEQVALPDRAARARISAFSLGMTQRLGLAAALLGDPDVLVLDEPVNGLDAEGIIWLRSFLRRQADQGRTVLVSSHLMTEVARTADRLVVIGGGRVLADLPTDELIERYARPGVRVTARDPARLAAVLRGAGWEVRPLPDGALSVTGATAGQVGDLAGRHRIVLESLGGTSGSLEDAYLDLVARADTPPPPASPPSSAPATSRPSTATLPPSSAVTPRKDSR
ncbi:ATP-binding cassette domain-containing protein [Streptomyces sp. NPDC048845]|uniref:ABC transporter ATP-binding protein n=1 Tax=Streptomyces sp. NPDC048845 TaxID=3155390 RepID=UPI003449EB16